MTAQQTPDRGEVRALADNATPGPWEWHHQEHKRAIHPTFLEGRTEDDWVLSLDTAFALSRADAEFIAAARTAVPALLDALDLAEARIQAVRGVVTRWETVHHHPGVTTITMAAAHAIRRALDGTETAGGA